MSAHPSSRPCPSTSTPPGATQLRLGCSAQPRAPFLLRPDKGARRGPPGPSGRGERGSPATSLRHGLAHGTRRRAPAALWRRPDSSAGSTWHSGLSTHNPSGPARRPPLQRPGLPTSVPLHEAPPAGASRLLCSASRAQFRCHLLRRLPLTPAPLAAWR